MHFQSNFVGLATLTFSSQFGIWPKYHRSVYHWPAQKVGIKVVQHLEQYLLIKVHHMLCFKLLTL